VIDGASISHNTAGSHAGVALGGGVMADTLFGDGAGAVVLNDSSVLNNTARTERGARADGGGLATFSNLTARNAIIVGNRALAVNGTCRGGGLFPAGLPALLHGGHDALFGCDRVLRGQHSQVDPCTALQRALPDQLLHPLLDRRQGCGKAKTQRCAVKIDFRERRFALGEMPHRGRHSVGCRDLFGRPLGEIPRHQRIAFLEPKALGERGRKVAETVTWDSTIERLLAAAR
jgi:hypothetical protein